MARTRFSPARSENLYRFCFCLTMSLLAAGQKLNLPRIRGSISGFLFVFTAIADLYAPETVLVACAGTVAQCFWKWKQRPTIFQAIFSC